MSDKQKTLAECKDEIARKHGHATFSRVRFAGTEAQLKILDEAAELYAGQTKQYSSCPASEADLFCKIYTQFNGEELTDVKQLITCQMSGEELLEFCELYASSRLTQQQSANAELQKQKEELVNDINQLNRIWSDRFPDCICNKHEKRYCPSHSDGPDC